MSASAWPDPVERRKENTEEEHQNLEKHTKGFEFSENIAPVQVNSVTVPNSTKPPKTRKNCDSLQTLCLRGKQPAFEMCNGHLLRRFFLFALRQLGPITKSSLRGLKPEKLCDSHSGSLKRFPN